MAAYPPPPTPLSCSAFRTGPSAECSRHQPDLLETCSRLPTPPRGEATAREAPRRLPARVTRLTRPLSGLTGLRPRQAVPRVPPRTGRSEGDSPRPCGTALLGRRGEPTPGPVRFLRRGSRVSVLTAPPSEAALASWGPARVALAGGTLSGVLSARCPTRKPPAVRGCRVLGIFLV